jgi:hypothetical protein
MGSVSLEIFLAADNGLLAVRRPTEGVLAEDDDVVVVFVLGKGLPDPLDSPRGPAWRVKLPIIRLRASSTWARVIGARPFPLPFPLPGGRLGEPVADACIGEGDDGTDGMERDDEVEGMCDRDACTA